MEARNCRDLLLNKLLQLRPLTLLTPQIHNYKYKCTNTNTTNTQVHKYALDSIVTHICSLLIGVLHSLVECRNPNTEQQCQILHCLKSVAPDPQAVSQCPTTRLLSIQVQTRCQITTTDYAGICLPGDSVETDRLVSGRLWTFILRQFHIFFRGIKFIVIEKCLWRKLVLKSA